MSQAIQLETEFAQLCDRLGFSPTLATGASETAPPGAMHADDIEPGSRVDRYLVLRKLGAGAMGVVYAAYDPKLDRKIALKLLRADVLVGLEIARKRLEREAQALAKLAHPNVVSVYDVDVHAQHLFVAMEFVEGETLGTWLRQPRTWPEVLETFDAAGRGLAAAHAAGLVHRDFKPENVMLGDDGRVRVMDFGLARQQVLAEIERPNSSAGPSEPSRVPATSMTLASGAVVGTPAYMALEQFEGRADALSDQFAFCVALYEGLYGRRPFTNESVARLLYALASETLQPTPKDTKVPTWLHDVVVRGLAAEPRQRWPSMDALLHALSDDPRLRRRRLGSRVLLVGLVVGATLSMVVAANSRARTCEGFESRLAGVWDAEQRQRVNAAFEATGLNYATDSRRRVEQRLDDYAEQWLAGRREACEATQQGEQSGELLDLRMRCFDERLEHMAATVELLANADADVVRRGVEAVASLPDLSRCTDIEALQATEPRPEEPELAARVDVLDEQLIAAEALERAGKYDRGHELATRVVVEAEALGYEPLQVRAWLTQASLAQLRGDHAGAEASWKRAYATALGLKMLVEAEEAARRLTHLVGHALAQPELGRAWLEHATPLARAVGSREAKVGQLVLLSSIEVREGNYEDARMHLQRALAIDEAALAPNHPDLARTLTELGAVYYQEGDYEEARESYERALAIREQAFGPEHPLVASTLGNLGKVAEARAKYDEARAHDERALASLEHAFGPNHAEVGATLQSLGRVATAEGKHEQARQYHERALASLEHALGPEHPDLATTLNSLGILADMQGDYEQAGAYFERSLAISERALGPDHPRLASSLNNLGLVARALGDYVTATAYFERALTLREQAHGRDHPGLAYSLGNLGGVAQALGDHAAARAYYERALAIDEQALGPDHPDLAYSLLGLGEAYLGLAETQEAIPWFERALVLRTRAPGSAVDLAQTRFMLARALWDAPSRAGRDRARAVALAELAAAALARAGETSSKDVDVIRDWLAAHEN